MCTEPAAEPNLRSQRAGDVPSARKTGAFVLSCACAAIVFLMHTAHAGADAILAGEYKATVKWEIVEDPGGQDCAAARGTGVFSFGVHIADGAYVLVPRDGFPIPDVIRMGQNGRSLSGTYDEATAVHLSFRGKHVTGAISTDRRCTPVYSFKGTWKTKPMPAPAPACTAEPATCPGETLCVNKQCVAAFGRVYTITVLGATIPPKKPDGSAWDPAGGAPDPFAIVTLNDKVIGRTSVAKDTFSASWLQAMSPVAVPAGSVLKLDLRDKDAASDDAIFSCAWQLTADTLHAGMASCAGQVEGASVGFVTQ